MHKSLKSLIAETETDLSLTGGRQEPPPARWGVRTKASNRIEFGKPPAKGTVVVLDGQFFEMIGVEPYRRKTDGEMSQLLTWRSQCMTCGRGFTVKTGLVAKSLNRRCDEHKAAGQPATEAAQARKAAFRQVRGARHAQ